MYGTCCRYGNISEVVQAYLDKEVREGRVLMVGSHKEWHSRVQCSPFVVIPKKGKPGKRRLILDLSALEGHSVNDGIAKELCRVQYISVDDVVRNMLQSGPGAWLAKADVQGMSRCTQMIEVCWVCHGRGRCMWMPPCLLGSGRPRCCSPLWGTWWNG